METPMVKVPTKGAESFKAETISETDVCFINGCGARGPGKQLDGDNNCALCDATHSETHNVESLCQKYLHAVTITDVEVNLSESTDTFLSHIRTGKVSSKNEFDQASECLREEIYEVEIGGYSKFNKTMSRLKSITRSHSEPNLSDKYGEYITTPIAEILGNEKKKSQRQKLKTEPVKTQIERKLSSKVNHQLPATLFYGAQKPEKVSNRGEFMSTTRKQPCHEGTMLLRRQISSNTKSKGCGQTDHISCDEYFPTNVLPLFRSDERDFIGAPTYFQTEENQHIPQIQLAGIKDSNLTKCRVSTLHGSVAGYRHGWRYEEDDNITLWEDDSCSPWHYWADQWSHNSRRGPIKSQPAPQETENRSDGREVVGTLTIEYEKPPVDGFVFIKET